MAVGDFFSELKRRHVYRAGAAYAVAAFVLIEIVSNLAPILDLPDWIARGLILLLIVGFPITLLAAWMIEARSPDAAPTPPTTRLDYVLAGALVVVIGFIGYDRIAPTPAAMTAPPSATAGTPAAGSISIAVLPFVNLSGDPSQEFFSDGMTEEITSALAKVKDLRVVGRTSAFEFKGQNKDLHAIGIALRATHLLEGSVRRENNQIRVTAQLIRADNGTHVWTDNYDRELKGVFAIQDEIAQAIAGALQVPLGLSPGATLVSNRDITPKNYEQYLRALALLRGRGDIGGSNATKAVSLLEPLVVDEPRYAPAWALLAHAYRNSPTENPKFAETNRSEEFEVALESAFAKARVAASRAVDLDPRSAEGFAALSVSQPRGNLRAREEFLKQAFQIDPLNPFVTGSYSLFLAHVGRVKEALVMQRKLISVEPSPLVNSVLAMMLGVDGQNDAALTLAEALPLTTRNRAEALARAYAALGKYADAADAILSTPPGGRGYGEREAAAALLRKAPQKVPSRDLPDLKVWGFVYLYVGAPDRADLGGIDRASVQLIPD